MKNVHFYSALVVLFFISVSALALTPGKIYKLSTLATGNKSVMVKNSSLTRDADIVNWSETGVNSQRWILNSDQDGKYQITNSYSGKILYRKGTAVEGATIYQFDKNELSAGKWEITPVDGQEGYFYITQMEPKLYLEIVSTTEGSLLHLQAKKEGTAGDNQKWKLDEVTAEPNYLTATVRDIMMQKWKERYYKKAPTGYVLANGGWWGDAEMFEVVLDAYETTGQQVHEETFRQLYINFIARNKTDWMYNEFNDDIAWMVIASARAYLMFGDQNFLTYAKNNFDKMYARALLPSGMLRWKETEATKNGTNSCINGPAEVAACYLAMATGDENYYTKAKNLYALQRQHLYVPTTGQVYDSFTWVNGVPSNYNHWASTYNQGTFLGAAVMLYNHFGHEQYKEDAKMIMKYTAKNLCDENGIINVCQVATGDLSGFKGILMRYIRRFIVDLGQTEYTEMMQKNAFHAYNNRNSAGISSSAWLTKAPENFIFENCTNNCSFANDPFGPSTAVSAAFNAPLNKNRIFKNAFSKIEAENFDYVKGIHVKAGTDDNSTEVANIKSGFYTGYNNVDFGSNLANKVQLRVSKAALRGTNIEIRVGSPTGKLIGTIVVPREGDNWQTVEAEIEPIDGLKNIYFVYKGTEGQELLRLNYFNFKTDNPLYPDITDNGGVVTNSHESLSEQKQIIDNRLSTKLSLNIQNNSNPAWIQYKSPVPVVLKGYALGAANDAPDKDPKSWRLQASNNGTDWTDLDLQANQMFESRFQKKQYDLLLSNTYTYFRLAITEINGNANELQLAEWQLYGGGLFVNDITADGGLLTSQYTGNETEETITKLTDKQIDSKYLVFDQSDLWVEYKANGLYALSAYSITSANDSPERDPKNWILYGSEDGKIWIAIDQQINQVFPYRNITQTYHCQSFAGYRFFKLHITANSGASITQLAEWQLHGGFYYDRFYNDVTLNGGELSSSSNDGVNTDALKNITDNNGNSFYTLNAPGSTAWIQYKSTVPVQIRAYSIIVAGDDSKYPKSWILQGSNDGNQWTTINSRSNITFTLKGERKVYPVTHNAEYRYFRLNITRISGAEAQQVELSELELHGTGFSSADITANNGTIMAEIPGLNTFEGENKLIDKLSGTKYCGNFSSSAWFKYQSPTPVKPTAYSITSANDAEIRDPKSWTLEASNDGNSWTMIDARNDQIFPYRFTTQYYACNKDKNEYTHFRLNVNKNNGANLLQFSEWQLLNIEGAGGMVNGVIPVVQNPLKVDIYPNPVQDYLHINTPEEARIDIYNIAAQLIHSTMAYEGINSICVDHYKKGIYIVKISTSKNSVAKRIIKK